MAAGTPVAEASTSGRIEWNRCSRSGDRSPRSRIVGARSLAGWRRSRTSGSVLTAKRCSRAAVARVSRRNVGRIWKVSASASSREESAEKVASPFVISPRSCPFSREIAWNVAPGVAHDPAQRHLLVGQRAQQVRAPLEERRGVAQRVVQVGAELPVGGDPGVVQPLLEVAPRAAGRRCGRPRRAERCRPRSRGRASRRRAAPSRRAGPAPARRRSPRAGSSGAGSRACPP